MNSAANQSAITQPAPADLAKAILDVSTQLPGRDVALALDLFLISTLSIYVQKTLGSDVIGRYGVDLEFFLRRPLRVPKQAPVQALITAVDCYGDLVRTSPWSDALGSTISVLGTRIPNNTRLVTPAGPAKLLAAMTPVDRQGFMAKPTYSLYDPFCGSGGNMLAIVGELITRYGDQAVRSRMNLTMVESDPTCATISTLQLLANQLIHGPLQAVTLRLGDCQKHASAQKTVFYSANA